jgi:hypothetical protein
MDVPKIVGVRGHKAARQGEGDRMGRGGGTREHDSKYDPHHHYHTEPEQDGVVCADCELHRHCLQVRRPQHEQKVAVWAEHAGMGTLTSLTRSEASNKLGTLGLKHERG